MLKMFSVLVKRLKNQIKTQTDLGTVQIHGKIGYFHLTDN